MSMKGSIGTMGRYVRVLNGFSRVIQGNTINGRSNANIFCGIYSVWV